MKDHTVTIPKPPRTKRIVILGDSLPFPGVNPTFVDFLKERYKNETQIEILNASTPGYTDYQELLFLKKYLLPTDPDIVVLCYVMNDNPKFLHQFDPNLDMLFTDEAKVSLQIHGPLDKFVSQSYVLSSLKARLMKPNPDVSASGFPWDGTLDFNTAWKDESWPDVESQIREMKTILTAQHAQLVIVIFPLMDQLNDTYLGKNRQYVLKPQMKLATLGNTEGIPVLDLFDAFYRGEKKRQLFVEDGLHLTTDGHRVTADMLFPFLQHL